MFIINHFDAETESAIKNSDITYLLKHLKSEPENRFLYNILPYLNGACNFGSQLTLKELLKLHKHHYAFDLTKGIVQECCGKPYSALMEMSIRNHNNACLHILFDHIRPHINWIDSTVLISQCINQALRAKNITAIKIAFAFEKSCSHTLSKSEQKQNLDLWWGRLRDHTKDNAQHIVDHMEADVINNVLVCNLNQHSTQDGALEALVSKCRPKKVLSLLSVRICLCSLFVLRTCNGWKISLLLTKRRF